MKINSVVRTLIYSLKLKTVTFMIENSSIKKTESVHLNIAKAIC